ncbi:DUF4340 domain-containing protein [Minwuia sp.]|uniref:DUF4340 domain-containing protein n=1 Tax=Minwuia sp. TaxID=2493630 RepID=UPI003A937095
MKRSTWLILLIVTVLFAGAAVWSVTERNARLAARDYGTPLFPGLDGANVNRIAELRLDTGHEAWTLKREASGRWVMVERAGYPVDPDRVKQAVVALANATILAPRTADPAQHHRLNLDPPAAVDSEDDVTSIALSARGADGAVMADLLIGKVKALPTSRDPGQAYVRRAGEDRTWLVEGRFDIRKDPTAWLDKTLFRIPREEISAITVHHPDGEVLRLVRNRFGTLNIADLPDDRASRDVRLTATQRALEFLPFADVKPAAEVDMSDATVTTLYADDGTAVTVRSAPAGFQVDKDPGYWVTFSIEHDPELATTPDDLPIPGPNDEGKQREVDVDAGAARATEAQARTDGWAYLFAEFTAQNFRHTLETLSEPKEES